MDDTKKYLRNLLFLDIDGVLNHKTSFKNKESLTVKLPNSNKRYEKFSLKSKELLNELILEFDLDIILSSSWRKSFTLEQINQIWKKEKMQSDVKGFTPYLTTRYYNSILNIPRGFEIEHWLSNKGFHHCNWSKIEQQRICNISNIRQYCILDDDSDMLYNQRNNFVHVLQDPLNITGFNEQYYQKARTIFLTNIV